MARISAAQAGHALTDATPVELDGLAGAARTDALAGGHAASGLPGHGFRPSAQARQEVLELGELDWALPSRDLACWAKMSRMRAVRSTTLTPTTSSRARRWEGASSPSTMTVSARRRPRRRPAREPCRCPGRWRIGVVAPLDEGRPRTSLPAVSARAASSRREVPASWESCACGPLAPGAPREGGRPGQLRPTRTTFSRRTGGTRPRRRPPVRLDSPATRRRAAGLVRGPRRRLPVHNRSPCSCWAAVEARAVPVRERTRATTSWTSASSGWRWKKWCWVYKKSFVVCLRPLGGARWFFRAAAAAGSAHIRRIHRGDATAHGPGGHPRVFRRRAGPAAG